MFNTLERNMNYFASRDVAQRRLAFQGEFRALIFAYNYLARAFQEKTGLDVVSSYELLMTTNMDSELKDWLAAQGAEVVNSKHQMPLLSPEQYSAKALRCRGWLTDRANNHAEFMSMSRLVKALILTYVTLWDLDIHVNYFSID